MGGLRRKMKRGVGMRVTETELFVLGVVSTLWRVRYYCRPQLYTLIHFSVDEVINKTDQGTSQDCRITT